MYKYCIFKMLNNKSIVWIFHIRYIHSPLVDIRLFLLLG